MILKFGRAVHTILFSYFHECPLSSYYSGNPEASDPAETAQQMIQMVKDIIEGNILTKTKGTIIILMHDHMFRTSRGNKQKLFDFVQGLKDLKEKYKVKFMKISEY